jgi:hypothetical protein
MNVNAIKNRVIDVGLAKKDRFEVVIPGMSEESNLLAKAAGIGELSVGFSAYRYTPPTSQHPNDIIHSDLSIDFYVDKAYNIRREFQNWIDEIVNLEKATFGYRDDYARDIIVRQLDPQNQPVVETEYLSCVPKSIGALQSSFDASEEVQILTVTFIFNRYNIL